MAEVKFNFYSIYSDYYKNINYISKYNVYIFPNYELFTNTSYYMETLSKFYRIRLPLYLLYELWLVGKMDYKVYKSLKKINRKKIFVKTIFKFKNHKQKIYNLFKF